MVVEIVLFHSLLNLPAGYLVLIDLLIEDFKLFFPISDVLLPESLNPLALSPKESLSFSSLWEHET